MYGINREEVVASFKSEYIIKMLSVQLVKLLTLYDMCNKSSSRSYVVQPATGELVSLQGGYDRGKILTI